MRKKKIVLPVLAAVAFALLLWLAFHDRSASAPAIPDIPTPAKQA